MRIEIRDVNKQYKTGKETIVNALNNVSLSIEQGDFLSICGVSGSGKTTLLNVLGCLMYPDSGRIMFDDVDVTKLSNKELARFRNENIGFVFQDYALIPYRTVYENLQIPLLISKEPTKNIDPIISKILESIGISELKKRKVSSLSGGQKQRVAIARALVCNPSIILADEPTGALDSANKKSIVELLKIVNDFGKTVIVVTHDSDVANASKRILNMVDGVLDEA